MELRPLEPLRKLFAGGDVLLISPPFAGFERPSLGLHVLQAVAQQAGFNVDIFNANVHFAACFGEDPYTGICYADTGELSGEKFFAPIAFPGEVKSFYNRRQEEFAEDWVGSVVEFVTTLGYSAIGCNTMFEQLNCSIALLERIKKTSPETITLLGGAQCEGNMGEAIIDLCSKIDLVFQGESEETFLSFLRGEISNKGTPKTVLGMPLVDMESLPRTDFSSFFQQFEVFFPTSYLKEKNLLWVPMEGSRGCWWGQKHHCTFCGINGNGMGYRNKSAAKVLEEIDHCVTEYGVRNILMVDNIMPHEYFSTLLPEIAKRDLGLKIFYEQKANLTAGRMAALAEAGANLIQPGIESLSDDILQIMNKGVKSWQNINALRHARMYDVYVNWNLLHSLPGDRIDHYNDIKALIPLLHHLCPPIGLSKLSVDRFSPYFDYPDRYGVANIRAMDAYYDILPKRANIEEIAYHFLADYDSELLNNIDALNDLKNLVAEWVAAWEKSTAPPVLSISQIGYNNFLVTDTRSVSSNKFQFVDRNTAVAMLFGSHSVSDQNVLDFCIEQKFCVQIKDVVAPLAHTQQRLFHELCGNNSRERPQTQLVWKSETEMTI